MITASKIQKAGIGLSLAYAAAYAAKTAAHDLKHLAPSDFGAWWPLMNGDLVDKLDQLSDFFQGRLIISPAFGALGRPAGNHESQHFPAPFVRAADVMIPGAPLRDVEAAARQIGFTGIGLYPKWKPHPGAHLDVRPTDRVATWAGWPRAEGGQRYLAIGTAYA